MTVIWLPQAMDATAAVPPRLSKAAISPHLLRPRTALSQPLDYRTAANLFGSGGVISILGRRSTTGAVCRSHAAHNEPAAIRAANAPLQLGVGSAINVSSDYHVHNGLGMDDGDSCLDVERTSKKIHKVKAMLESMGDGEISISAYDTAWVALVPDLHGNGGPQFPSSLQWIEHNQLPDGSWGDTEVFLAHDRLMNTLACVIALKSWGICYDRCQRGISFLWENMHRLEEHDAEHMPIGFEVVFPSLLERARSLDLEVPYDTPALREIYAKRALKLERIPKDVVHKVPTTLLHSLEGTTGLDWEKLLHLQCADGSFLFSPASTAFALMQTGDAKCLGYLENAVQRFNGGVPNVYPVDLFEHMWAVDRLERLGISRYFKEEIRKCLDYVHKYWTENGIAWARTSNVQDVDDTAMGFRLLRLHGYDVSADVLQHFEKDGEFFCFIGQSNQAITGIYNLNRASQVCFPGEKILEEARIFSYGFLREKQARNELSDKWIITKDLPGEVRYALDFPWYASLPRVETRMYLEQYGGSNDVWIGKTLYRMPYVSNDDYLELAKSDFSRCQALHQLEWIGLQRWYAECGLRWYGVSKTSLLKSYFLAAVSIFEPERAAERLGWARTAVLAEAASALLRGRGGDAGDTSILNDMRQALCVHDDSVSVATSMAAPRMLSAVGTRDDAKTMGRGLVGALIHTLDLLSLDTAASLSPGGAQVTATLRQIRQHLRRTWDDWMLAWREEENEDSHVRGWWPGGSENGETALLLVRSLELCAGRTALEEALQANPPQRPQQQRQEERAHQYAQLTRLTSSVCRKLPVLHQRRLLTAEDIREDSNGKGDAEAVSFQDIEPEMQELTERVLRNPPDGGSRSTLGTFLTVAKSLYYVATCPPATLEHHIAKVLFEEIV